MNVVVDVGNTRIKYAFFEEKSLIEMGYSLEDLEEALRKHKEEGKKIFVLLSASGRIPKEVVSFLKEVAYFFQEASVAMSLPLKIGYLTPETLGFDRIAICVGAMKLFPNTPLLVIDSGTCITFNYVDAMGVFLGGNISPGLEIRFKSLHQYTAKLPNVLPEEKYGGFGRTTEEAIRNGVMFGMLFEIKNYIHQFRKEEPMGAVVITGGNAHFLKNDLFENVRFCDTLGFVGLNEILQYIKTYSIIKK